MECSVTTRIFPGPPLKIGTLPENPGRMVTLTYKFSAYLSVDVEQLTGLHSIAY